MTLNRVPIWSPNYSARNSGVRLIVVHTAEGSTTIESLGAWFQNPASSVSSHTGADDKPNTVGEFVSRDKKAWTQANANPYSVAIECCGFASWTPTQWAAHPAMLDNCAQWIAEEAAAFGIPIRRLSEAEAAAGQAGVCGHDALGYAGNDHWDPGPSFPWADVLAMAAGGASAAPTKRKGRNMIASTDTGLGYWTVTSDGAVGAFGDAVYAGGGFAPDVVTGEIIGIAGKGNDGYWLFASDGGVLAFGSAGFYGRPDRA